VSQKSSGVVSGSCKKNYGAEPSAKRKVAEWEQSGCYRNRLERGAAFLPLTLCSHALSMNGMH